MKKLTDKQKSRLWELQRNRNFQASRRLEGVENAFSHSYCRRGFSAP
ncbi:conserved inner membrane protein [Escherichia coli 3006]|nr:conserved inner membrane protein [Escherichia coli 3006]